MTGKVLVVGSANMDLVLQVSAEPDPGRTVLVDDFGAQPGGKGANQAIAAARLGVPVAFVGCLGDDDEGHQILRALRRERVDAAEVDLLVGQRTGLAIVLVRPDGENSILVAPGANSHLSAARARDAVCANAAAGDIVVVQAEVSREVVLATLAACEQVQARAVLNLAPYMPLDDAALAGCDPLVVNEVEAAAMVGHRVDDVASAAAACTELSRIARSVVVTIGAAGACWADAGRRGHQPASPVPVVDTTGAGDAFVGALSAALAGGMDLGDAVDLGVRAGSFAVRRLGAQVSYPARADLGLAEAEQNPAEQSLA